MHFHINHRNVDANHPINFDSQKKVIDLKAKLIYHQSVFTRPVVICKKKRKEKSTFAYIKITRLQNKKKKIGASEWLKEAMIILAETL